MATPGTPNPQGGAAPDSGAAPAAPQGGGQQANQLQVQLAQLAKACEILANQNAVVQPELMQCRSLIIQSLRKTMMASAPQGAGPAPEQGQ